MHNAQDCGAFLVTVSSLDPRYAGFGTWRTSQATWGVSSDADRLLSRFKELARDFFQTATAQRRLVQPLDSLIELCRECANPDWDGEGARPIKEETANEACTLLLLLPPNVSSPTLVAEPSGAIAFEWYKRPNQVLVLSVNGNKSIQFAALLGDGNESHGKVNFSGSMPKEIQDKLDAFGKL